MKWPTVNIGKLCVPTQQCDPRLTPDESFLYVDISTIDKDTKTIVNPQRMLGSEAPSRARKEVRAGDVLVSTVRPNLNAVAVVPPELDGHIASTGFCVLRSQSKLLLNRYLFYRTLTPVFIEYLTAKMRGANYPAVTDNAVKSAPLPLPSPSEQRRIVEILDQADALRKKHAEADAKAGRILPALFLKMFGDPVTNPKGWPTRQFQEVADSRLGKMLDAKRQTGEHLRPYLRNTNIQWDRLDLTDVFEMDFDPSEREEFRLRKGDLLICEGGEVGRCAIWNEELPECYFQKALHRVRPKQGKSTAEYLLFLFWSLASCGGLRDSTSRMTITHLTGVELKRMRIPVPPFEHQRAFSELGQRQKSTWHCVEQRRQQIETLFNALLHRAFSGDLTAQWREAHMQELLAEMEEQAKALNITLPATPTLFDYDAERRTTC